MSDKNAWDDSFLQNSWNDAKYHSIAKSGKRLEDVLTQEELRELRDDHGDLIGEAEAASEIVAEADDNSDQMDTEDSTQEMEDAGKVHQQETQPQLSKALDCHMALTSPQCLRLCSERFKTKT
ncbi:hypothetical protein G6514_008307 [Epicoccum nigrum]|nr:hypothetical protein G6514_008307 [Epicoccum nigrum]